MTERASTLERRKKILARLRSDFPFYAEKNLKVLSKPDDGGRARLVPFKLNSAQVYLHKRLEEQMARTGRVRALVLKGRQQGISTYIEGRNYHRATLFEGVRVFILTHSSEATGNLFGMVSRYHEHCNPVVKPFTGRANARELVFDKLDSRYQVSTAGAKGAGRSATLTHVHGSEVAFWEQAETHLDGLAEAVADAPGTEIVYESTAFGVGNMFHKLWKAAQSGASDFEAIFIPWFWQAEYVRECPDDFELSDDPADVPDGELTEVAYARLFKLRNDQMNWRRHKIRSKTDLHAGYRSFQQEYPATPDEAFQAAAVDSLISRLSVLNARKSNVATPGALIIGVDPAGDIKQQKSADETAIIRRRTRRAFDLEAFNDKNSRQIAKHLHRIIMKEKPSKVVIDAGGGGREIADSLNEMKGTQGVVMLVNFGGAADDPDQYANAKAEMIYQLKDWLDDVGGANIPDDDDLQGELLSIVADFPDNNQRRRIKSKKWMASQGLKSPNRAEALALTMAAKDLVGGSASIGNSHVDYDPLAPGVGGGNNPNIGNADDGWNALDDF